MIGYVLAAAGFIFAYLRFGMGFKPDFLKFKVFAFYSTYFDTKYFRFIDNNFSEEICGILIVAGLFLIAFSRERKELDHFWYFRVKSFILAGWISVSLIIFSFLFIYGIAFLNLLSILIFMPLLIYIIIFKIFILNERISSRK